MSTVGSTSVSDGDTDGGAEGGAGEAEFDPERILYHAHGLVAIDKPSGVPVHRGTGHESGIAEILERWISLNPGVLEVRPGVPLRPVHRLDLEASGVLVLATTSGAASRAQEAFASRQVTKRYLTVVAGPVEPQGALTGSVRTRLRGRYRRAEAEIHFRRLRGDERLSLIEVVPQGGRTHQIRAILAEHGRPVAGDLRYGKPRPSRQFLEKFGVPHLLLHAWQLVLPASVTGKELALEAPLPQGFLRVFRQKGWSELELDARGCWRAEP
jgi:23S rRNA-/tRNA-specific pseudouridylate synthase